MSTSRASPARCGRAAVTIARLEASLAVEMRKAPFRITSRSAPLRRSTSSPLRPSARSSTSTAGLTPPGLLPTASRRPRRRGAACSPAAPQVADDQRVDVPLDVFGQRRHVVLLDQLVGAVPGVLHQRSVDVVFERLSVPELRLPELAGTIELPGAPRAQEVSAFAAPAGKIVVDVGLDTVGGRVQGPFAQHT